MRDAAHTRLPAVRDVAINKRPTMMRQFTRRLGMEPEWLAAWGSVAAAAATVLTLAIALRVLATEQSERMRSDVKGARFWLEIQLSDDERTLRQDALDRRVKREKLVSPCMGMENATSEIIYDVRMQICEERFGTFIYGQSRLLPGQRLVQDPRISISAAFENTTAFDRGAGVEATFADGRGYYWLRDRRGRLTRVGLPRPWAPWRVPHHLVWQDWPWWAVGVHLRDWIAEPRDRWLARRARRRYTREQATADNRP